MLRHIVTADDLIADDRIDAAVLEIHERRQIVRVLLDVLVARHILVSVHIILRRARSALGGDDLVLEVVLLRDRSVVSALENHLLIVHVRLGKEQVLLALLRDLQSVPQRVDAAALDFGFLARPVDSLELDFRAQTLRRFLRQFHVEARDLVLLVEEAHRREVVVKTDDDLLRRIARRLLLRAAAARRKPRRQDEGQTDE